MAGNNLIRGLDRSFHLGVDLIRDATVAVYGLALTKVSGLSGLWTLCQHPKCLNQTCTQRDLTVYKCNSPAVQSVLSKWLSSVKMHQAATSPLALGC